MSRTQIYIIAGLASLVVFVCIIAAAVVWIQFASPQATFTVETRAPESSGEIDSTTILLTLTTIYSPTYTLTPTSTATRVVPDTATPQPATPAQVQPIAPTSAPKPLKCRVGSGTMWVEVDCTPTP